MGAPGKISPIFFGGVPAGVQEPKMTKIWTKIFFWSVKIPKLGGPRHFFMENCCIKRFSPSFKEHFLLIFIENAQKLPELWPFFENFVKFLAIFGNFAHFCLDFAWGPPKNGQNFTRCTHLGVSDPKNSVQKRFSAKNYPLKHVFSAIGDLWAEKSPIFGQNPGKVINFA